MKNEHKYLADRLRNDGTAIGSWISTVSPSVAELMARSGFDYLTIDAEHSPPKFARTEDETDMKGVGRRVGVTGTGKPLIVTEISMPVSGKKARGMGRGGRF